MADFSNGDNPVPFPAMEELFTKHALMQGFPTLRQYLSYQWQTLSLEQDQYNATGLALIGGGLLTAALLSGPVATAVAIGTVTAGTYWALKNLGESFISRLQQSENMHTNLLLGFGALAAVVGALAIAAGTPLSILGAGLLFKLSLALLTGIPLGIAIDFFVKDVHKEEASTATHMAL